MHRGLAAETCMDGKRGNVVGVVDEPSIADWYKPTAVSTSHSVASSAAKAILFDTVFTLDKNSVTFAVLGSSARSNQKVSTESSKPLHKTKRSD